MLMAMGPLTHILGCRKISDDDDGLVDHLFSLSGTIFLFGLCLCDDTLQ